MHSPHPLHSSTSIVTLPRAWTDDRVGDRPAGLPASLPAMLHLDIAARVHRGLRGAVDQAESDGAVISSVCKPHVLLRHSRLESFPLRQAVILHTR
jgi:hypothetical protein